MTILEMLDRLEVEILALRARQPGVSEVAEGATRAKARTKAKRSTKSKKSKRTRPRTVASRTSHKPEEEQLALPVHPTETQEGEGATVGKRRALGRSLLHLRKLAAAARGTTA